MSEEGPHQPIAPIPASEVKKICAGEVVERPLSVVKELVENSLDAGASEIIVELEDGGKELIRVTDNGSGIPYAELPLALKPHHTSKLRSLDDLYALTSLGFRGEALSSIATVSKLVLGSRHVSEDVGGRIEAAGGELLDCTPFNLQTGTDTEISELFFNTPARRKFLRSRQAETSQISNLLTAYALAFPEVRWVLRSGGREILRSDGDGDERAALGSLLGPEVAGKLARVNFEFPPSAVRGYITDPSHHRHNRARQWYFVNRRPVADKLFFKAVDDAVREFMSPGKYPAGAFYLELPPEEIDVNVHPMKAEVKFAQPQAVYSLLSTAVRRALGAAAAERQRDLSAGLAALVKPTAGETPSATPHAGSGQEPPPLPGMRAVPVFEMDQPIVPQTESVLSSSHSSELATGVSAAIHGSAEPELRQDQDEQAIGQPESTPVGAELEVDPSALEVLQLANTYLVIPTPEAVYLVDQHAAHERILFEELHAALEDGLAEIPRQQLLFPMVVPLSPGESEAANSLQDAFRQVGISCHLGAGRNLVITEAPVLLAVQVTPELVHAILGDLSRQWHDIPLRQQVKEVAASLACRAAVKAGQPLPPDERIALLRQLIARWSSLTCPHGRPTVIRLGSAELERLFHR